MSRAIDPMTLDVEGDYIDEDMIDGIEMCTDVDRLAWLLLLDRMPWCDVEFVEELCGSLG